MITIFSLYQHALSLGPQIPGASIPQSTFSLSKLTGVGNQTLLAWAKSKDPAFAHIQCFQGRKHIELCTMVDGLNKPQAYIVRIVPGFGAGRFGSTHRGRCSRAEVDRLEKRAIKKGWGTGEFMKDVEGYEVDLKFYNTILESEQDIMPKPGRVSKSALQSKELQDRVNQIQAQHQGWQSTSGEKTHKEELDEVNERLKETHHELELAKLSERTLQSHIKGIKDDRKGMEDAIKDLGRKHRDMEGSLRSLSKDVKGVAAQMNAMKSEEPTDSTKRKQSPTHRSYLAMSQMYDIPDGLDLDPTGAHSDMPLILTKYDLDMLTRFLEAQVTKSAKNEARECLRSVRAKLTLAGYGIKEEPKQNKENP